MPRLLGTHMLTIERLQELLHYDPETGAFSWRVSMAGRVAGRPVGSKNQHGYVRIRVDGRRYMAHQLAWFYVHGEWPKAELDHRNRVRDDNRIENLRPVTHSENMQNRVHARRDNTAGLLGAHIDRGRWTARITVDGKERRLGYFPSPEAAHAAYMDAKAKYHPIMEDRHDGPRATDSVRP